MRSRRAIAVAAVALTVASTPVRAATEPSRPDDDARIVVLAEEFLLADVLALGLEPIATTVSVVDAGIQGIDEFDTSGIEILPMTTLNLEELATLEPDVIVTLQFWVDQVGESALADMADLVIVPDGLAAADRILAIGELLGRPDEAAAVVGELDEATAAARGKIGDDCVVSLAVIYSGPTVAAFVDGPWDLPSSILAAGCRLDPDPSQAEPDQKGRAYLSLEQLGLLDAPQMILLQSPTVEGEDAAIAAIEANPLWQRLPAVASGDVIVFDRLGYPGATGQIRFLGELAAGLSD